MVDFELKHHFRPKKGWMNDPNGLVYYNGWYHAFFQHAPEYESPWHEPMVWGHARTKDFLHWEELPVALRPDKPYDKDGVWSGTAAVFNGRLYLFYASVIKDPNAPDKMIQTVSMAYSDDGMDFVKCDNNPIIASYPEDGSGDFRDPAVLVENGRFYIVMASGKPEEKKARLLLYESDDAVRWSYTGILYERTGALVCECPSIVKHGSGYLLSTSVLTDEGHFFEVLYGDFDGKRFEPQIVSRLQKGPDEYAGQIFADPKGRSIMMSWIPGWAYSTFAERSVGCLSLPVEITVKDGGIIGYPVEEVRHLLDENGSLTDNYVRETFVNGGEEIHVELLKEKFGR